jgi:hypothetical protein
MVKAMFEKHTQSDTVIEADFIDDKAPAGVAISETAARAASALESLAEAVSAVAPDKAEKMHERAAAIRVAGASIEAVVDNGKALLEQGKKAGASVKELLARVGIEPELVTRPRGRRGAS